MKNGTFIQVLVSICVVIAIIVGLMFGIPKYNVWQQEMEGKAEMARAEQNRMILVEEAKAKLEAEKLNAQAEIERAKGMAEAMEIQYAVNAVIYKMCSAHGNMYAVIKAN